MNKKGFTLIELMISISIIGILGAFVYSALNIPATRDRAEATKQKVKMQDVASALETYKTIYGNYPSPFIDGGAEGGNPLLGPDGGAVSLLISEWPRWEGDGSPLYYKTRENGAEVPIGEFSLYMRGNTDNTYGYRYQSIWGEIRECYWGDEPSTWWVWNNCPQQ